MHSPHLISIIKRHHHLPQRQCPSSTTLRFQQQFVLDDTPFQIDLIHFSSHPRLLLQYLYGRIPMGIAVDVVSSKFLDCSLPFNHYYVTYADLNTPFLCFRLCFSLRATRYSCFHLFHKASLQRLIYYCHFYKLHVHFYEVLHQGNLHHAQESNNLESESMSQFLLLYTRLMACC